MNCISLEHVFYPITDIAKAPIEEIFALGLIFPKQIIDILLYMQSIML